MISEPKSVGFMPKIHRLIDLYCKQQLANLQIHRLVKFTIGDFMKLGQIGDYKDIFTVHTR